VVAHQVPMGGGQTGELFGDLPQLMGIGRCIDIRNPVAQLGNEMGLVVLRKSLEIP